MARLQCRACGFDQEIEWDGRFVCPSCGSTNARVAAATADLSEAEVEMIMQGDFPERQPRNSDHVEKTPAMSLEDSDDE